MSRVLLLGLLGACYSPSYRDCEVGCVGGACPSGLSCDPLLQVCRVEGAGGACGSGSSSDAAPDTTRDTASATFCGGVTGAAYCEDFDRAPLAMQGFTTITENNGGTVQLVSSARSAPSALEATTPQSDGTTAVDGQVQKTMTLDPAFTSVVFAFDVNFVQRDGALQPKGAAHLGFPGYTIDLASNGATQAYFVVNSQSATYVFDDGLVLGTWYRYEITVTRSGQDLVASAKRDGMAVGNNNGVIGPSQPIALGLDSWDVWVGAFNTSQNGACRFDFDNIVVIATL